jgi:hypothetical protein
MTGVVSGGPAERVGERFTGGELGVTDDGGGVNALGVWGRCWATHAGCRDALNIHGASYHRDDGIDNHGSVENESVPFVDGQDLHVEHGNCELN